jgi:hypothetical protein
MTNVSLLDDEPFVPWQWKEEVGSPLTEFERTWLKGTASVFDAPGPLLGLFA